MHVVGHEAIGPHRDARLAVALGQEIAVEGVVAVREEHALTPIALPRDMMRQAGNDDAAEAGHEMTLQKREFGAICKVSA
jgi:hypothetical protein